jgi:hypothetical protein
VRHREGSHWAGAQLLLLSKTSLAGAQRLNCSPRTRRDGWPQTVKSSAMGGVGRKYDQRPETGATFRAVPNMTDLSLIAILGPFGGNQLIVAMGAAHPEARTTIGYYRHWNLTRFASMRDGAKE